jgi:hypothetical protein
MSHPKLKGQRLGQVVYNAIEDSITYTSLTDLKQEIASTLFYISDEDLTKLINDYLKEI